MFFFENERLEKPGMKVEETIPLHVKETLPYVGRGGYKLEKALATFDTNIADHEELHDYTRSLAVEYGKDFEKKVVLSGKYSFEEQDEIQGEYRRALADKVRRFLTD